MKGLLLSLGMFSVVSMAAPVLEPVTIKQVHQFVNLMPPLPPGGVSPRSTLKVDVVSTGCTKASDFKVVVEQQGKTQQVSIIRLRPDLCEVVAHPEEVELRTNQLRSSRQFQVKVANPLLVDLQEVH